MHPSPYLRPLRWLLIPLLAIVASGTALAAPKPDPALDPAAVVRFQLDAMAHVDQPVRNAGLATVFGFASPGNRAQTGPLPHFVDLLRKSYPDLLNHRSAILEKAVIKGDQAFQKVELIDRAGHSHRYLFILSRQRDAPYKGCWMTDGVINAPDEPGALET